MFGGEGGAVKIRKGRWGAPRGRAGRLSSGQAALVEVGAGVWGEEEAVCVRLVRGLRRFWKQGRWEAGPGAGRLGRVCG